MQTPVAGAYVVETVEILALRNEYLEAAICRRSGNLIHLRFCGREMLHTKPGRPANTGGYWSIVDGTRRLGRLVRAEPMVPAGGKIGEVAAVSCHFAHEGESTAAIDCEVTYFLCRGQSVLYASARLAHPSNYPSLSLATGRFALKLNPAVFDFLAVDQARQGLMATGQDWRQGVELNMKEARRLTTGRHAGKVEHKYDYAAVLFDTPAYGWAGTRDQIGVWMLNPSIEYISGGATKVELTGHIDEYSISAPTLLNVWHGPHYGGCRMDVSAGEQWQKCIGPFAIYCNHGGEPEELWRDALQRAEVERSAWPYPFAAGPAYPTRAGRGSISGRIVINDPYRPAVPFGTIIVGLVESEEGQEGASLDWQQAGRTYQYWTRAASDGRFRIDQIRPGRFALRAICAGVLGELAREQVEVVAGAEGSLGVMEWIPDRRGWPVWEIGFPDRTAGKFRNGDAYWRWGLYYDYSEQFPNDVRFIVGVSDYQRDWNYAQPPRIRDGKITSTTWSIEFEMTAVPKGRATLRIAIAGSRLPRGVRVAVNGKHVGSTGRLPDTGTMHRDGIRGLWCERSVEFNARRLVVGKNTIDLHAPALRWAHGILYDYLRLEIAGAPPASG